MTEGTENDTVHVCCVAAGGAEDAEDVPEGQESPGAVAEEMGAGPAAAAGSPAAGKAAAGSADRAAAEEEAALPDRQALQPAVPAAAAASPPADAAPVAAAPAPIGADASGTGEVSAAAAAAGSEDAAQAPQPFAAGAPAASPAVAAAPAASDAAAEAAAPGGAPQAIHTGTAHPEVRCVACTARYGAVPTSTGALLQLCRTVRDGSLHPGVAPGRGSKIIPDSPRANTVHTFCPSHKPPLRPTACESFSFLRTRRPQSQLFRKWGGCMLIRVTSHSKGVLTSQLHGGEFMT